MFDLKPLLGDNPPDRIYYSEKPPRLGGVPRLITIEEFMQIYECSGRRRFQWTETIWSNPLITNQNDPEKLHEEMRPYFKTCLTNPAQLTNKLMISFINDEVGFGVFAREHIKKYEVVLAYAGEHSLSCPNGVYALGTQVGLISALTKGGMARFMQHLPSSPYHVYHSTYLNEDGKGRSEWLYRSEYALRNTKNIEDPISLEQYEAEYCERYPNISILPSTEHQEDIAVGNVISDEYTMDGVPFLFFSSRKNIEPGEQVGCGYGREYWNQLQQEPLLFDKNGAISPVKSQFEEAKQRALDYFRNNQYQEALGQYSKTLSLLGKQCLLKTERLQLSAVLNNNLGACYRELGRYKDAVDHFSKAIEVCRMLGQDSAASLKKSTQKKELCEIKIKANKLNKEAVVKFGQEKWQEAVEIFLKVLELNQQFFGSKPHLHLAAANWSISSCYLKLNANNKALDYARASRNIRSALKQDTQKADSRCQQLANTKNSPIKNIALINVDFKWQKSQLFFLEMDDAINASGFRGYNQLYSDHSGDEVMLKKIIEKLKLTFNRIHFIFNDVSESYWPRQQFEDIQYHSNIIEFLSYCQGESKEKLLSDVVIYGRNRLEQSSEYTRVAVEIQEWLRMKGFNIPVVNGTGLVDAADDKFIFSQLFRSIPETHVVTIKNISSDWLAVQDKFSDEIVLKPRDASEGSGVCMLTKNELSQSIDLIQSYLDKGEDIVFQKILLALSDDRCSKLYELYEHCKEKSQDHILIQDYVASNPVKKNGKSYDATGRAVLMISQNIEGKSTVKVIDGYWKLPKNPVENDSICQSARLSCLKGDSLPDGSAKWTAEQRDHIVKIFHSNAQDWTVLFGSKIDFYLDSAAKLSKNALTLMTKYFTEQIFDTITSAHFKPLSILLSKVPELNVALFRSLAAELSSFEFLWRLNARQALFLQSSLLSYLAEDYVPVSFSRISELPLNEQFALKSFLSTLKDKLKGKEAVNANKVLFRVNNPPRDYHHLEDGVLYSNRQFFENVEAQKPLTVFHATDPVSFFSVRSKLAKAGVISANHAILENNVFAKRLLDYFPENCQPTVTCYYHNPNAIAEHQDDVDIICRFKESRMSEILWSLIQGEGKSFDKHCQYNSDVHEIVFHQVNVPGVSTSVSEFLDNLNEIDFAERVENSVQKVAGFS